MGRRKSNISQPMVLDIMLAPFQESFYLEASDTTQQWFYANNGAYKPNHAGDSPLFLTPRLKVVDPDTNTEYTPTFYQVSWLYRSPNGGYNDQGDPVSGGDYAKITNTTDGSAASYPYVIYADGHIKINRNIPYNDPLTLLCVVVYNDPRSLGSTHKVRITQDLVTSRDATLIMPTIDIECENLQLFDPFVDANSNFSFAAKVTQGITDITSSSRIKWYVLDTSTQAETPIDTLETAFVNNVAVDYIVTQFAEYGGVSFLEDGRQEIGDLAISQGSSTIYKFQGVSEAQRAFVGYATATDGTKVALCDPNKPEKIGKAYVWSASNSTWSEENCVPVFKYPCYVSGQFGDTLVVNAMYTERINIVARIAKDDPRGSHYDNLYPCKALRALAWDDIPMESKAYSKNSGAVRDDTEEMEFDTIVNIHGQTLTDAQKSEHLMFSWYRRNAQASSQTFVGNFQSLVLKRSELLQWETQLVYNITLIKGANEMVTCNGEAVTSSGQVVFCRTI